MIYLLTFFGVPLSGGAEVPFRFAEKGYNTKPSDTPSNTHFEERIKDIGAFTKDLYGNSRTYGETKVSFGSCTLVNTDGALDYLNAYAFDGRDYKIEMIQSEEDSYSTAMVVQQGKLRDIEISLSDVNLILKDDLFSLDKPLLTVKYAGTNILPDGIEGTEDDIKGKVKPLVLGEVRNISPVLVNTSKLIYQVSFEPVAEILAYDGGQSLTNGGNFALNDFLVHNVSAGHYVTNLENGLLKLHAPVVFQLTCDVKESLTAADNRAGRILKDMALKVYPLVSINNTSIAALDTAAPYVLGIFIDDESSALENMDMIAESVGAYYIFDENKQFTVGRLLAPSATAVQVFDEVNTLRNSLSKQRSKDTDRGIPAYRVTLNYAKNYTVLTDSDIAGNVKTNLPTRYGLLQKEYRTVNATDNNVLTVHPESPEIIRNTLLISASNAQTEANRLLNLYKVRRDVYTFSVRVDDLINPQNIQIGTTIELKINRFGLSLGKKFVVLTITNDFTSNKLELTVWG